MEEEGASARVGVARDLPGVGVTSGSSTKPLAFVTENERAGLRWVLRSSDETWGGSGLGVSWGGLRSVLRVRGEGGTTPIVTLGVVWTERLSGSGVCALLEFLEEGGFLVPRARLTEDMEGWC